MERRDFLKAISAGGVLAIATPACDLLAPRQNAGGVSDLPLLDMISQASLVQKGEMSALELVDAAIERIERINPKLNAIIATNYDSARKRARNHKNNQGQLWASPYLIKDLTAYKNLPFTQGARLFKNRIAQKQTPYVDDIEKAGMIVLGKTNTPEFGLISSTESLALGACRNPWNLDYSCAGSSGGAASAVAGRIVPAAQASDGGGSIRLPANVCGLFGLKPSRGRFGNQYPDSPTPRWEISISHMVSWSVRDSALILALTEKDDILPPVGYVDRPLEDKLKIAVSMKGFNGELPHPEVQKAVRHAIKLLQDLGHELIPVRKTPLDQEGLHQAMTLLWASGAAGVKKALGEQMDKNMDEWLEPWTLGLAREYDAQPNKEKALDKAIESMRIAQERTRAFLTEYDAWLTPVASTPPPKIGDQAPVISYGRLRKKIFDYAYYTPLHNMAGTPAMSVPMHWTKDNLPIGVQLAANISREDLLLKLALQIETAQPWADKLPPTHA